MFFIGLQFKMLNAVYLTRAHHTVVAIKGISNRNSIPKLLSSIEFRCTYVGKRDYFSGVSPSRPNASEVLTCHLESNGCPPWTSYFVRYDNIVDDQWGRSHFNWIVGNGKHNYHILRTGCFPFIKYHCSKRPHQDLRFEDAFFRFIKVFNLGLPCLAYGIAAIFMIRHKEQVVTSKGPVTIYFLYAEDRGSHF